MLVPSLLRRSYYTQKLKKSVNLATRLCYVSLLLCLLQEFNIYQTNILNAQNNRKIFTSTISNLINNMCLLVFATKKAENEVF